MEEEDTRKLITFERELGLYSVASAICSYGDVIDFVDDEKQGIVLIDTIQHHESSGVLMGAFLKHLIKEGWGIRGGALEELCLLSREIKKIKDFKISIEQTEIDFLVCQLAELYSPFAAEGMKICAKWYEAAGSYTQFNGTNISHANSGIPFPRIFRRQGNIEEMRNVGNDLDDGFYRSYWPEYNTFLFPDDVMLLHSDGLEDNMRKYCSMNKIDRDNKTILNQLIHEHKKETPQTIRDIIISTLSDYFSPHSPRDDDVTFVIVKRNEKLI